MQEEVEQRVVTLIVNCSKLTEQELRKALGKLLTHLKTQHQTKQPQPISLMDLADAVHREKKASVLEKLKDQPQQPRRKSKPRKTKEKEL